MPLVDFFKKPTERKPDVPVSQGKPVKEALSRTHKTNAAGIAMMHSFESCKLVAYPDPGSRDGEPWTIGWGSTSLNWPQIKKGLKITQKQADDWFAADLAKFENAVSAAVKVPLTGNQFSALVCFTYNVGIGSFNGSTLLRLLNKREYGAAADQLLRWDKNDGKVMRGLTRRRTAERALFLS